MGALGVLINLGLQLAYRQQILKTTKTVTTVPLKYLNHGRQDHFALLCNTNQEHGY
jgi:hypothetical protein